MERARGNRRPLRSGRAPESARFYDQPSPRRQQAFAGVQPRRRNGRGASLSMSQRDDPASRGAGASSPRQAGFGFASAIHLPVKRSLFALAR